MTLGAILEFTENAISSSLGDPEPFPTSTRKILKWHSRKGLTVNVGGEGKSRVTVWIAGPELTSDCEIDLATGIMIPAVSPKNSNLSPQIKVGPTVFLFVRETSQLSALESALAKLTEKLPVPCNDRPESMATPELEDNFEGNDDDDVGTDTYPESQRTVITQPKDESIDSLVRRMQKGRLIVQPDFQRQYVWNPAKASALIESVLLNIPLPVIYAAELENNDWEVVDGQQRLTSIRSFIEGSFPDGSAFRLGSLKVRSDLKGKSFKELSEQQQRTIEDYTIRVILITKAASADLKFEVFERLNSGADKLNDMELRNCMYRGAYNDLLKELSFNQNLLTIRGDDKPDVRMQDRQLILRFFAMWRNTHLRYTAPVKRFMNIEMRDYRDGPAHKIDVMRRVFEEAIQCAYDVFGKRAFRRYNLGSDSKHDGTWEPNGKLNIALWDTILYTFSYFERRQILPIADAIREEFLDMMASDETFIDYIGRTTDKPDRVKYRAKAWKERLDRLVQIPENETRNFNSQMKLRMFQRQNVCGICSQQIHSVEDAEIDHIEHYWRGGATSLENSRLAHRYCNRKRGGRD